MTRRRDPTIDGHEKERGGVSAAELHHSRGVVASNLDHTLTIDIAGKVSFAHQVQVVMLSGQPNLRGSRLVVSTSVCQRTEEKTKGLRATMADNVYRGGYCFCHYLEAVENLAPPRQAFEQHRVRVAVRLDARLLHLVHHLGERSGCAGSMPSAETCQWYPYQGERV